MWYFLSLMRLITASDDGDDGDDDDDGNGDDEVCYHGLEHGFWP